MIRSCTKNSAPSANATSGLAPNNSGQQSHLRKRKPNKLMKFFSHGIFHECLISTEPAVIEPSLRPQHRSQMSVKSLLKELLHHLSLNSCAALENVGVMTRVFQVLCRLLSSQLQS